MGTMFLNILHRTGALPSDYESFKLQQDLAHRAGIKTTIQLGAASMANPELVELAKAHQDEFGDEISIALHEHELLSDEVRETFQTEEFAIYLHPFENKKRLISFFFEKFHDNFGFYPVSVGSYALDAQTTNWLKASYPTVKIAINNCFEEGIHMYRGCKHVWYLFTEGGP